MASKIVSRTEGDTLLSWHWYMSEGRHHMSEFMWLFVCLVGFCLFVCLLVFYCVTVLAFPALNCLSALYYQVLLQSLVGDLNRAQSNCP